MTVRPAAVDDLPRLVELIDLGATRAGKEDRSDQAGYRRALAEIDAAPHDEVLVAVVGGEVVGVCQVFAVRHLQERGGLCAEVESVHVHPDVRGGGVGSVLLDAAVAQARAWGCYRVQLTSDKTRGDAHRFYARHGFTATHEGFKLRL
ncbi:GNAT family N-acetyltransferase [Geodermatophilus sp. DSM 44513]|uniref:GNAT family N-acetyltransferase n=1 Tax=Geodermatophilus sp. DSM 44513 TaxID=1528104 RepID=UPI001411E993|nr:GNAT family N-acetyltransferase [Geodermatophilus sp. DSM 44513]WNV74649.1 GNAT family N-acetyltransferase [Geodermatophilus sp. DSM 44513]